MITYPKASKIIKPPSLRPIRTDTTDIRKTFAAARRQMAAAEECKTVKAAPLVVDTVLPVKDARALVDEWREANPKIVSFWRK